MTGRAIEYVFPPRARRPPTTRPRCSGRGAQPAPGSSPTSASRCAPARSSGSPDSSAPGAPRSSRPSSGRAPGDGRHGHRRRAARCAPGRSAPRSSAGIGLCPGGAQEPGAPARRVGRYRNITLASLRAVRPRRLPRPRAPSARRPREQIEALDVRPADVDREMRTLSGGNQQKVVLARWLLHGCRVLLLDEPTRGVDVGARVGDLRAHPPARRRRGRRRRRLQRDRGGARPRRPRPGDRRGRRAARRSGLRHRRARRARPRHGGDAA